MKSTIFCAAKCFAVFLLLTAIGTVQAQEWPAKNIRIVIPFAAGGTADVLARTIGDKLSEKLPQRVVPDNRVGAGGNVGADAVAKSKPDGLTLLLGTVATHSINPHLYKSLVFDARKDFAPVALVATMPNIVVVNPSVPAKTFAEFMALAKSKPGALAFASSGNGTTQHLSVAMFEKATGAKLTHVPYKGSAPAIADLIAGHVQVMFDNIPLALEQVKGGKLRALAVTSPARSPAAPDIPTVAESGIKDYAVVPWFGVFAPAGTPAPIVDRLNKEITQILQDKSLRDRFAAQGVELARPLTPQQFAEFLAQEFTKWGTRVKESGATIE